jgi:hypothetical protein
VARTIRYMAVRYDGGDGFADLEPNDKVSNGSNPYIGKLSVLKQWNDEDGPAERLRGEPQQRHLQHLPAQPEPVHRPPRVGGRDLVALPRQPAAVNAPRTPAAPAPPPRAASGPFPLPPRE